MSDERKQLLEYMENVVDLEKNLYVLKRMKYFMEQKKQKCEQITYEAPLPYKQDTFRVIGIILSVIFLGIAVLCTTSSGSFLPFFYLSPFGFIWVFATIFVSMRVKEENIAIRNKNISNETYNAEKKEKNNKQLQIIHRNISQLNTKISETRDTLNKFYNEDIIYGKYRNITALCSFLDYYKSGRCDSLQGRDGAYNIFENELRLNLIIEKVDSVIDRLDNIQQNQHTLFNILRDSNHKLTELTSATNQMLDKLANIEETSALNSYYSSVNAINSGCQSWLMDASLRELKAMNK